jgi:hypothetical protein
MSLDSAFFVSDQLHERKVTLPDGSEHTLHFRELLAHEFLRYRDEQRSESAATRERATPRIIALSLRNPDGTPAMTDEQAAKLRPGAMSALMAAVMEVNTFDAKKPSPSAADSGSATS